MSSTQQPREEQMRILRIRPGILHDRSKRPAHLPHAESVSSASRVGKLFAVGGFVYQFKNRRGGGRSRVMLCSSREECDFIVRQVERGATVFIQHYELAEGAPDVVMLNGEHMQSADQFRKAAKGTPLYYQMLDPATRIESCESASQVEEIACVIPKRDVVVRPRS